MCAIMDIVAKFRENWSNTFRELYAAMPAKERMTEQANRRN